MIVIGLINEHRQVSLAVAFDAEYGPDIPKADGFQSGGTSELDAGWLRSLTSSEEARNGRMQSWNRSLRFTTYGHVRGNTANKPLNLKLQYQIGYSLAV